MANKQYVPLGGEYNSTLPTYTDGQPVAPQHDNRGRLMVNVDAGGTSGTQYTDGDAAVTHPVGTIPVFNNGGTITAVSAANPLPVSATISTAGLATSAKQDTGNTSVASIDTKTPALGQALAAASVPVVLTAAQITTLTPPAAITGFSTAVKQSDGSQKTQIVDGSGNVIGSTSNALDINIKSGSAVGNVAHDGVDSGNPVKIGGKASTSISGRTMVSDADRIDFVGGADGVQIFRPNANLEDLVNGNASNTDGTSTQVIAAQAAGVKTYITDVTLTNTSASNIYVELKDNTTVKWTFPLPANGGVTHHFASPLGGTAATAWNFDPSASATTVYCSASGFKSKL